MADPSSSDPASAPAPAGATEAAPSRPAALSQPDEPFDERDSVWGDEEEASTASLSASILEYRTIHGRTFHNQRGDASYWGPNDERQQESMDISHHVHTLRFDGALYLAPIKDDVQKVVDIGTGTGIWAIDFADKFPNAEVIGTDLSPIQPTWVPPNLKFEIDDATQDWTWNENTFDFVHARALFGSIADWNAFFANAYRVTKPGGWCESVEGSVDIVSDDGTIKEGDCLYDWGKLFWEAGKKMGRPMDVVDTHLTLKAMKEAGFVDVVEKRYKVPVTSWSADPKEKEIGRYSHVAIDSGLEGYALFMLTQVLGWQVEEVHVFLAKVRRALKSKNNHGYFFISVVYGRKPE